MFNFNDIYSHLVNGGDKQVLFDALMQEIQKAENKIQLENEANEKAKKLEIKKNKARVAAFSALKAYFTLVNPEVTDDIINSVLDTLETVEVKINGARGRDRIAAKEMKGVWDLFFPRQ